MTFAKKSMKSTKKKFVERDDGTVELGYGPVMKKTTYMSMRKYRDEYVRDNYRMFNIKVNKNKYPDIIEYMEGQDNLVMYIVDLIRSDMGAKIKKERSGAEKAPVAIKAAPIKAAPIKATTVRAAAAKKQPKETKEVEKQSKKTTKAKKEAKKETKKTAKAASSEKKKSSKKKK